MFENVGYEIVAVKAVVEAGSIGERAEEELFGVAIEEDVVYYVDGGGVGVVEE